MLAYPKGELTMIGGPPFATLGLAPGLDFVHAVARVGALFIRLLLITIADLISPLVRSRDHPLQQHAAAS